ILEIYVARIRSQKWAADPDLPRGSELANAHRSVDPGPDCLWTSPRLSEPKPHSLHAVDEGGEPADPCADAAAPGFEAGLDAGEVPRVVHVGLPGFGVVDEAHDVEVVPAGDGSIGDVGDDLVLAVAACPHREALAVDEGVAGHDGADWLDGAGVVE